MLVPWVGAWRAGLTEAQGQGQIQTQDQLEPENRRLSHLSPVRDFFGVLTKRIGKEPHIPKLLDGPMGSRAERARCGTRPRRVMGGTASTEAESTRRGRAHRKARGQVARWRGRRSSRNISGIDLDFLVTSRMR